MWPFNKTRNLNTLEFVGDGDELEAVEIIEKEFEIAFKDEEVEQIRTIGEYFKLIWSKLSDDQKTDEFAQVEIWNELCIWMRYINGYRGPIDMDTTFIPDKNVLRDKRYG